MNSRGSPKDVLYCFAPEIQGNNANSEGDIKKRKNAKTQPEVAVPLAAMVPEPESEPQAVVTDDSSLEEKQGKEVPIAAKPTPDISMDTDEFTLMVDTYEFDLPDEQEEAEEKVEC